LIPGKTRGRREEMAGEKRCIFYRASDRLSMGIGIGYCDFTSGEAICDGDVVFCEFPEALKENNRRPDFAPAGSIRCG
jgi:hypothetical protein